MYAFGVSMLELVTGRRAMAQGPGANPGEESMLTEWIRPFFNQRRPDLSRMVDPRLHGEYRKDDAMKMIILGKHCIHDDPTLRPDMSVLVQSLDGPQLCR